MCLSTAPGGWAARSEVDSVSLQLCFDTAGADPAEDADVVNGESDLGIEAVEEIAWERIRGDRLEGGRPVPVVGFLDWDVPEAESAANVGVSVELFEHSSRGLVVSCHWPGAGSSDWYSGFGEDDCDLAGADPQLECHFGHGPS